MGIFSTKKKTYVDTAVVRIVDESMLPNALLEASIESIFTGKPIAQAMQTKLLESPFRKFERMYRYARDGGYYYNLPNARVLTSSDGAGMVHAVINYLVGTPVIMDYAQFRPLNNVHMGWAVITDSYGYNHETNELTVLSAGVGHPVYLEDLVALHDLNALQDADGSALGVWGISPQGGFTPERRAQTVLAIRRLVTQQTYEVGTDLTEGVEIKYIWEIPAVKDPVTHITITPASIERGSIFVSLAAYDMDLEYHQVKYHVGSTVGYFTYQPDEGVYPDLDAVFASDFTTAGTYFPFAVFRREKQNRATPALESTNEYITTKKLLSYINIDFQEFSDSIHENPDIADVEQAVLMMAVPMNTTNKVEIDYLMRFFSNLESTITFPPKSTISAFSSLSAGVQDGYAVEIADADFKIVVSFDRIEKKLRAGNVGAIGTFTNSITEVDSSALQPPTSMIVRTFRKQITETVYEEIKVYNAQTRYDIYAGKSTIGAGDDDELMIPLDYTLCRQMSILKREELYYRSLHLVANSRVTEKVRWYQTGLFKALLVIVAVVLTVITQGAAWKTVVAAASIGASAVILAVLKVLAVLFLKGMVVSFLAQKAAEILGPELAALLAVVAMVYGGAKAYQSGGLVAGSSAAHLVNAATALSNGAMGALKKLFLEYQKDVAAFDLLKEDKWAELEEAEALLRNAIALNPMAYVGQEPLVVFGESPDAYYSRTVHSGNIGTRGFEIIQNFVAVSLTLPSIQSTVGDYFYGV